MPYSKSLPEAERKRLKSEENARYRAKKKAMRPPRVKVLLSEEEKIARKRAANAAYREKNRETLRKKQLAYLEKNRTSENARSAEYRAKNPNWFKEYYEKNKDEMRERSRIYMKNNPEKVRIRCANRRAMKKANGGKLSAGITEKLLEMQKRRCAVCRSSFEKRKFHLDHIVPLSKGGAHEDSNIQLLCPTCNISKGNKNPVDYMQSKGYLL